MLSEIDLTNKCGSCCHFKKIDGTASGECLQNPYGDDIAHDPNRPHMTVARSRMKCKLYNRSPQTNADRIRAMSDEELAAYFTEDGWECHHCTEHERLDGHPLLRDERCDEKCEQHCLDWLRLPVKDGEDE